MYLVWLTGGFPAIVLVRATLLAAFCGFGGFLAARLSGSVLAGIAAAFATASVAVEFAADRPRWQHFWASPFLSPCSNGAAGCGCCRRSRCCGANCHGGFFMGWVVLAAYCAEFRAPDRRRVWLVTAASVALSLLNPNGYGVIATMLRYARASCRGTSSSGGHLRCGGRPTASTSSYTPPRRC